MTGSVGRKLIMAVTGQLLFLFIVLHVLGNSTIYFGKLNAYAAGLHALPALLWATRLGLLVLFPLHIYLAVVLTLENSAARPVDYLVRKHLASTFAGRNMVWTGAVIGTFLVYHLLHFTFQVIYPASAAFAHRDAEGRPDVFLMVARSFQHAGIVAVYFVGVAAVGLHLSHGIQSSFQTWGLNGERSFSYVRRGGSLVAIVLFLAYAAIPVVIFTGLLLR
jgi:succinate dehydrogenase / fumarate reductase cytochrome b subunit